jgi:hypothetical protein
MIIAISQHPHEGPWGGGNRFLISLIQALKARGHTVNHHLERGTDIILMMDPRWLRNPDVMFDAGAVLRHLAFVNPNCVVLQRINECDERKGEKFITDKMLRANYAADLTVFVGSWLMDLPAWRNHDRTTCRVILNGGEGDVYHPHGRTLWNGSEPMKLVTHHWSWHQFKGFDIYQAIDDRLDDHAFARDFTMTYVGNLGPGFRFKNINMVKPLNGTALADELRRHHVYVTGSIGEPGGNHQNEGAQCGLPLLFRNSGCLPEYCTGYGEMFNGVDNFFDALSRMRDNYATQANKILSYPHTAERMIQNWINLFDEISARRPEITKARRIWRNPFLFARNQIPL